MRKPYRMCALVLAVSAALSACGGGGGDDDDDSDTGNGNPPTTTIPEPSSNVIKGSAASGLPLIGTVTVKDAAGASKTVSIGENGSYTVDVTGMTAPFLFRAEGTVSGRRTVLHSAATAADANGTINITQLTDLIVANIAGQLASNYFDSGNFSTLTAPELDAEVAALKAKLLPVLQAMGVEDSIDLLRTSFTPQASALDKALDVLRVSVDEGVATITNLVTQQQIQDSLSTRAAQEANAPTLPAQGMDTAAADIDAIRAMLARFTAQFADGAPSSEAIRAYLVDGSPRDTYGFRHQDETAAQFAGELAEDPSLVGASFADVAIRRMNYVLDTENTAPRAWVDFTHKDKNGVVFSIQENFQVVKGTDNVWRLRGDGSTLSIDAVSLHVKNAGDGCLITGLEFLIEDINVGNSSAAAYAVVTGPGLPSGGVRYQRPGMGGYWTIAGQGSLDGQRYYRLASTCSGVATAGASDTAIAAIPQNAFYTITGYTPNGDVAKITNTSFNITAGRRVARPLTLAEIREASFAQVATSAPLASYQGGPLTVSATGANPAVATAIALYLNGQEGGFAGEDVDVSTARDGTASADFDLSAAGLGAITGREARVGITDSVFRELLTVLRP
ncbi:hypothetical protein [Bordetella genomosp. 13]|uniref:hypothetical protein n=1 Tax=Bordetella genomosp. 13 TaxID=463040 RepID=UPI0011A4AD17|nr:hypothetical protein [Bordetella genomosp. 13]